MIDYFEQCKNPNPQHFFFAEMINKGQYVMTTNFDFLIEYALIQSEALKNEIIPVITESDFRKYSNPQVWLSKGKKLVYKIHGSTKNIITGEHTRTSLIATIKGFGMNKEGMNVFQIEPFKRPLFENITKNRTLVVIGYSGSDDFDITPTLLVLDDLEQIIWINHVNNQDVQERIYEIKYENNHHDLNLDKINNILIEIKKVNPSKRIYRVDANTSRIIEKLLTSIPNLKSQNFSLSLDQWLKGCIHVNEKVMKLLIPFEIYNEFNKNQDSLRVGNQLIEILKKLKFSSILASVHSSMGCIFINQKEYDKAFKYLKTALSLYEKTSDPIGKANCLINIGNIYLDQNKNDLALKFYKNAVKNISIIEQLDIKVHSLHKREILNIMKKKYPKADRWFRINRDLIEGGDYLFEKADAYNKISEVYMRKKKFHLSIKYLKNAIKITDKLGGLQKKAYLLHNLGFALFLQNNHDESLIHYQEALKIANQLGDLYGKCNIRSSIGLVYRERRNYNKALKCVEEALKFAEILNDKALIAFQHNLIGEIKIFISDFSNSTQSFKKALEISEKVGGPITKARYLTNLGMVYQIQGNKSLALKYEKEALRTLESMGLGSIENAKIIRQNIIAIENNVNLRDLFNQFMNQYMKTL